MKKILIPNGSYAEIPFILKCKEYGLEVLVSGRNENAPGNGLANRYISCDYSDHTAMLQLAQEEGIDFVSDCANDLGTMSATYIAEKMDLPGHDSFATAEIISEKGLFKTFAQKNGLSVIPSNYFENREEALEYIAHVDYPIIVKPVDLFSGIGVSRAESFIEAQAAVELAFQKSIVKKIVVEPFIVGSQHSICTFLVEKKVVAYSSLNEYSCMVDPYAVGYSSFPALDIEEHAPFLIDQIEKMAKLLNLADGLFHVQYFLFKGKPLIIECMRRPLGNLTLDFLSHMSGFDYTDAMVRAYCNMEFQEKKHPNAKPFGVHYYIPAEKNGILKDIYIAESLKPFLYDAVLLKNAGDRISNYCRERIGFLFMEMKTREEAESIIHTVQKNVSINMR